MSERSAGVSRQQRRAEERKGRKAARRAAFASGAALSLGAALAGQPAQAATFLVSNLNDAGPGSLRQAVADAEAATGPDVVQFQAGLTGTITLTTGEIGIKDSVDIQGPGTSVISVSGNDASRIFYLYNSSNPAPSVSISGLTLTHGKASKGDGGAISDHGESLTLDNVAVTSSAANDGGGVFVSSGDGGGPFSLTIQNSVLSGNTATNNGGAVYVRYVSGPVLIQHTQITGNTATNNGGGVAFYETNGDVTIDQSTISGNTAGQGGGGIYLYDTNAGTFTVQNSTVSGNNAADGAGVFLYGPDNPVVIENSTISGNTATGRGGGLFLYRTNSTVDVRHSTIANNSASVGGGIYLYQDSINLDQTIVADSNVGDTSGDLDGGGTFNVRYSLIENPGTANITDNGGNIFNKDPQLGPLADNGGPTQTQLPAATSPAVNAGDPAFTPPPATDQRGVDFPRVADARIDIGAVERQPEIAAVPTLGDAGKVLFAGLCALAAVALLRRRKLVVPAVLLSLVVGGAGATQAAPLRPHHSAGTREVRAAVLAEVRTSGGQVNLRLADGTTVTIPGALVQLTDHRRHVNHHAPAPLPGLAALPAGQPVVLKVRHAADGSVKKARVVVCDSTEQAQVLASRASK
jgi:parallel beta-helix repeat protein/predicted outer membrane repeat protein